MGRRDERTPRVWPLRTIALSAAAPDPPVPGPDEAKLQPSRVKLTDDLCDFLTAGVSILLASRSTACVPSIARACGCRVLRGERGSVRVVVSAAQAGELLDDIRNGGTVAATFTQPNTHRTLQLKGSDARIEALDADDRAAAAAYRAAFAAVIDPLGFDATFARAFLAVTGDEVVIAFAPLEAFQQTPGPAAGARIA